MNRSERKKRESLERKAAKEIPTIPFDLGSQVRLQAFGPIIQTAIGITESHKEALIAGGLPVPPPVTCTLLIDTGASNTLVKHEIADRAGLKLINANAPVHGVGVDTTGKTYLGTILFSVQSKLVPNAKHVFGVNSEISSGELHGASPHLDGLIGREVLQYFEFSYHGHTGKFSLRYIRPKE